MPDISCESVTQMGTLIVCNSERRAPMEIKKITGDNFQTEVTEAGGPVLVDFYTDWCLSLIHI